MGRSSLAEADRSRLLTGLQQVQTDLLEKREDTRPYSSLIHSGISTVSMTWMTPLVHMMSFLPT